MRSWGALLAGALAAACVPRGDPPSGRQVVADRISLPFAIAPANGDGVTRVLFERAGQAEGSIDLYVLTLDAPGASPVEHLLAAGVVADPSGCPFGQQVCGGPDARGRLLVFEAAGGGPDQTTLSRIDPVTGVRTDLGLARYFQLSPARQQLLVYANTPDQTSVLYDADDRPTPIDTSRGGTFVGEVLYYVTAQHEAMRLAPGGTPERLATNVDTASPLSTGGDVLVVLSRATGDSFTSTYSLLDTATMQETPSPLGTTPFQLSPDGRWLVTTDYMAETITFTDWRTGDQDVFQPRPFPHGYGYEWRPGHAELWVPNGQDGPSTTWIEQPGQDPVQVPGIAASLTNLQANGAGSMFTPDGAYWFSQADPMSNQGLLVGRADDPTGPRFQLTPPHTNDDGYWPVPDGRLVVQAWTKTPELDTAYVVDPATGDARVMGEEGVLLGVGRTRLLANQHMLHGEGDLTVFDLATGQATAIAAEFAMGGVVQPTGDDAVAPGAPMAFRFQARFPSPYDGIWLTTVP
ncbi:MAG TPA: hypothetical protein VHO67_07950 [Polyangia bacterium]|nr:hypothetical protein [Polyangia bacterium]